MLSCAVPVSADSIQAEVIYQPTTPIGYISFYSELYGVSSSTLYKVLNCESSLSPSAVGDKGTSYGVAQIHLPAHPEITKQQALDPEFAIGWAAKQFSQGKERMWSCYSMLFA